MLDEHAKTFLNLSKQLLCASMVFEEYIHDTDIIYILSDIIVQKVYEYMTNNIVNILKNSCPKYTFNVSCANNVSQFSKPNWGISTDGYKDFNNFRKKVMIYNNLAFSLFDNTWKVYENAMKYHYIRLGQIIHIPEYGNAEIISVQNKRYVVQYITGEKYTFKHQKFVNILKHPKQLRDVYIDSRLKLIESINLAREECIDEYLNTTPRCVCGETFYYYDHHVKCKKGHRFDPTQWKYPGSDIPMIQDLNVFLSYRKSVYG
uniref:Uncharacterized protein n=1 Tax=viral metagenome TaxID=1070528 RepID=A0A6C0CYG8_9ZZZZ